MEKKEEYIAKFETMLHDISAKIDELKVQASLGKAEARDEIEKQIESLHRQRSLAEKKLEELRNAGEGVWQDLRHGIEHAVDDMKTGIKSAFDRLR